MAAPSWTSTLAPAKNDPSEIRKGLFDLLDKLGKVVDYFNNGENIMHILETTGDPIPINVQGVGGVTIERIIYGENSSGATNVTDANNATKVGDYSALAPFTNTPVGGSTLFHTMSNTGGSRLSQLGSPTGNLSLYHRSLGGGGWTSWRPAASIVTGSLHSAAVAAGGVFNALTSVIPNTNDEISINGGWYNATHSFVISKAVRTSSTNIRLDTVRSDRTLQQVNFTNATVHTGEGWSISW